MNQAEKEILEKKSDTFWHRVYASVVAVTVLVITALSVFSYYFSR